MAMEKNGVKIVNTTICKIVEFQDGTVEYLSGLGDANLVRVNVDHFVMVGDSLPDSKLMSFCSVVGTGILRGRLQCNVKRSYHPGDRAYQDIVCFEVEDTVRNSRNVVCGPSEVNESVKIVALNP